MILKHLKDVEKGEIFREKGTNRSKFFRGEIDKYTWVDIGSSYLPSELNAAYLYAQLEMAEEVNSRRLNIWKQYDEGLSSLRDAGVIEQPFIPDGCEHNAHMYYIKVKDLEERTRLLAFLKERGISAVFHYVPLHSAPAGVLFGRFAGEDRFTTKESERLVRLPMHYNLTYEEIHTVIKAVLVFYGKEVVGSHVYINRDTLL